MEPRLRMWGLFIVLMVPGCVTGVCLQDPPNIRNATFKILRYEVGTTLNCDCEKGFRRTSSRRPYMLCTGNSNHSFWENRCQCDRICHCEEPPPWEHGSLKRIYHFVVGQTVHYQCAQGFRDPRRGLAKSICEMIRGKMRWTQPQLKCRSETENSQFPGDEDPPLSTEAPPGSETSRPLTTQRTDFEEHTDMAATMTSFILTTEYQIAVAGCVLLLISILLLSGLTWQRRWKKSRGTI
ncbi:interleukin-2 receptor subunit alpha isoform X2 [Camelus ferus]|uniref:Interleukin-2 receptor subunit alpha n=1 Tax=Camelus ferus TaxID=419612 RepID=A0A8B8SJA8_CAMFR|nr:interleukin-2 receptor subunit alpha isoform X2 [Camelus ferus]